MPHPPGAPFDGGVLILPYTKVSSNKPFATNSTFAASRWLVLTRNTITSMKLMHPLKEKNFSLSAKVVEPNNFRSHVHRRYSTSDTKDVRAEPILGRISWMKARSSIASASLVPFVIQRQQDKNAMPTKSSRLVQSGSSVTNQSTQLDFRIVLYYYKNSRALDPTQITQIDVISHSNTEKLVPIVMETQDTQNFFQFLSNWITKSSKNPLVRETSPLTANKESEAKSDSGDQNNFKNCESIQILGATDAVKQESRNWFAGETGNFVFENEMINPLFQNKGNHK